MEIFILKPLVVGKLNIFNDALMHRESLKGQTDFKSNSMSLKMDNTVYGS